VTSGKLYSERARCQHQFWENLSNANANSTARPFSANSFGNKKSAQQFLDLLRRFA
jgi:hypothetical protein